jgi:DNA-binding transcriptional ArsR family regulator
MFAILVRYLCSEWRFSRAALPKTDADDKATRLGEANPFAQDTFEYGAARKSIHVGAEAMEEWLKSLNKVGITPTGGSETEFEGTSIYYGAANRRSTITRKSVTQELMRLDQRRESRKDAQSSLDTARESSVLFSQKSETKAKASTRSSKHE